MQRKEILGILKVLCDTYDFEITDMKIEVWYMALKEFPCKDVQNATFEYIRTGKYKPKPADIIELIVESKAPQMPEEMSAQEAWALVYKAICNSAYNSAQEFDKLPELVKKAVGSADNLRNHAIDSDFNLGVAQSNFIKAYNTILERKKNDYTMKIEAVKRGNLSIEQLTMATISKMENKMLLEENIK